MIDLLNDAIYEKLNGLTAVTNLLASKTSIYFMQAVDDPTFDYIVLSYQAGGPDNETPRDNRTFLAFIRAYSTTSAQASYLIDNQISAALHQKPISVSGYTNYVIFREEAVQTVENPPTGKKIYMSGGIYRIGLSA